MAEESAHAQAFLRDEAQQYFLIKRLGYRVRGADESFGATAATAACPAAGITSGAIHAHRRIAGAAAQRIFNPLIRLQSTWKCLRIRRTIWKARPVGLQRQRRRSPSSLELKLMKFCRNAASIVANMQMLLAHIVLSV